MGDLSNEPSMEEILSSIKRIIAEDTDASLTTPRGRRSVGRPVADPQVSDAPAADTEVDDDDILELTDTAPEAESEIRMTEAEPEPAQPVIADVESAKPMAAAEAVSGKKPPLVSDAALTASRSSIAALSALVVKPEVHGGDTLEGLVREMLKPMLAEWLDERLPDVVERLVAQEIQRITSRG